MKNKVYIILVLFAAMLGGCLKDPELDEKQRNDEDDLNTVVQPGNDIASGVDILDGVMPLRYAFSSDGRRLIAGAGQRSAFYEINAIKRIDLTFSQSDWWSRLTANYSSSTDIPARMLYDGKELTYNVGVRFRGNTSYSQNRTEKKSFAISLDYEDDDQKVGGYKNLNINCEYNDNSFMREVIYGAVNQRYIPALSVNYVDLYINGTYWGIYVNSQQVDNDLIREWFVSRNGSRWRAESPSDNRNNPGGGGGMGGARPGGGMQGGGGGMSNGRSSLSYLGDNGSAYEAYYTLKNTTRSDPWQDLADVCKVLNQTSSSELEAKVREVIDLDRTLWYLASEIIFTDDDSYVQKGSMDYYIFWDAATGRLTPIEYDGNEVLRSNNTSWSPFYHETNANYPLLNKLLAVPNIRQRYLAHFRTILEESFNPDAMNELIDRNVAMIDACIQNDPKKMMTHAQFTSEVSNLKNIIRTRYNNLISNSEVNIKGLTISDVQWLVDGRVWEQPSQNDRTLVTAKISGDTGVGSVYLYGSTGLTGNFSPIEMFDDGTHGDGQANDGVYGCYIPAQNRGVRVRFYIEATAADNAKTKTYNPAKAEHDVYTYVIQ
jgi:spore coat protein CotH